MALVALPKQRADPASSEIYSTEPRWLRGSLDGRHTPKALLSQCVGVRNRTLRDARKELQVKNELNSTDRHKADMELVRRAQEGDPDAFASLFNAHKTRIYSVCLRMTSNTAEAEDLTQDAFLQAFRKLATFRGDSALSTWLYGAAVNTVLMQMRKKGLRPVSLDQPIEQADGPVK